MLRDQLAERGVKDWELVVFGAVLHVVRRAGAEHGMTDAEFFDVVQHDVALPPVELFPSADLPDDAGHFAPDPPPDPIVVGARERDLLARGVKPVIKVELLDSQSAAEMAAALEVQRFHARVIDSARSNNLVRPAARDAPVGADRHVILVAGRNADTVEHLAAIVRDDALDYREHARLAGELLGYPPCCVAAYAELPPWVYGSDMYLLAASVARTQGVIHAELDPFAPGSLTEYFPCRMDCPASLARARQAAQRPQRRGDQPPSAVLVLSPLCRIELDGVQEEPLGWRYGGAHLRGVSPWGEHILRHLRTGDRVEVLERLLLVYRQWDLLAAIPHGVIVPIAYGAPNRFPWLEHAIRQIAPLAPMPVAPCGEQPAASVETGRELPGFVAGPLGGREVVGVRVQAGSIIVDLDDGGLGELALELRLGDESERCYLRAGLIAVSYRLPAGAVFSPGVDSACRDLLAWAERHCDLIEVAIRDEGTAA
jgi:hypothetical protein